MLFTSCPGGASELLVLRMFGGLVSLMERRDFFVAPASDSMSLNCRPVLSGLHERRNSGDLLALSDLRTINGELGKSGVLRAMGKLCNQLSC